jgi:hypothetical protein
LTLTRAEKYFGYEKKPSRFLKEMGVCCSLVLPEASASVANIDHGTQPHRYLTLQAAAQSLKVVPVMCGDAAQLPNPTSERNKAPRIGALLTWTQQLRATAKLNGGGGSLERTALSLDFPANREFNREFLRFWALFAHGVPGMLHNSLRLSRVGGGWALKRTGNFLKISGI